MSNSILFCCLCVWCAMFLTNGAKSTGSHPGSSSSVNLPLLCLPRSHGTPVLQQLHWHPDKYCIMYKILLLSFKAIASTPTHTPGSSSSNLVVWPPWSWQPSASWPPASGTLSHKIPETQILTLPSNPSLKPMSSDRHSHFCFIYLYSWAWLCLFIVSFVQQPRGS